MNIMDSSLPSHWRVRMATALLLCALPGLSIAASAAKKPAAQETQPSKPRQELVLTLPNQWATDAANPLTSSENENISLNNLNQKKRTVNVDCAVDANPLTTYDNSLSNRWQGECNLGYRY